MWQVIYCAKGKNKLLSKSGQTLINEGTLGSSSGSWGNSAAKCHLDIWLSHPTQLGQKMCCFRDCNLVTCYPFQSKVWKVKCQVVRWFPVQLPGRKKHEGPILHFWKHSRMWIIRKVVRKIRDWKKLWYLLVKKALIKRKITLQVLYFSFFLYVKIVLGWAAELWRYQP